MAIIINAYYPADRENNSNWGLTLSFNSNDEFQIKDALGSIFSEYFSRKIDQNRYVEYTLDDKEKIIEILDFFKNSMNSLLRNSYNIGLEHFLEDIKKDKNEIEVGQIEDNPSEKGNSNNSNEKEVLSSNHVLQQNKPNFTVKYSEKGKGNGRPATLVLHDPSRILSEHVNELGTHIYENKDDNKDDQDWYTFSGTASVLKALDYLKVKHEVDYNFNELLPFHEQLQKQYAEKLKVRPIAKIHFTYIETQKKLLNDNNTSTNNLSVDEEGKLAKTSSHSHDKNSEYEAANAQLGRLYLGPDRAPDVEPRYKENNERAGVSMEHWPNLESLGARIANTFKEQLNKQTKDRGQEFNIAFSQEFADDLVNNGMVDVMVFNYFSQEWDGHFENIVFNNEGKVSRIDFDVTTAPLVKKWNLAVAGTEKFLGCRAEDASPITAAEIRDHFAVPQQVKPSRWIDKGGATPDGEHPELAKKIEASPKYKEKKYRAFLKLILIPEEDIKFIAENYIGKEKHQKIWSEHLLERQAKFNEELPKIDEFRLHVLSHPENIEGICKELKVYYQKLNLDVNIINAKLEKVREKYQQITSGIVSRKSLLENARRVEKRQHALEQNIYEIQKSQNFLSLKTNKKNKNNLSERIESAKKDFELAKSFEAYQQEYDRDEAKKMRASSLINGALFRISYAAGKVITEAANLTAVSAAKIGLKKENITVETITKGNVAEEIAKLNNVIGQQIKESTLKPWQKFLSWFYRSKIEKHENLRALQEKINNISDEVEECKKAQEKYAEDYEQKILSPEEFKNSVSTIKIKSVNDAQNMVDTLEAIQERDRNMSDENKERLQRFSYGM